MLGAVAGGDGRVGLEMAVWGARLRNAGAKATSMG